MLEADNERRQMTSREKEKSQVIRSRSRWGVSLWLNHWNVGAYFWSLWSVWFWSGLNPVDPFRVWLHFKLTLDSQLVWGDAQHIGTCEMLPSMWGPERWSQADGDLWWYLACWDLGDDPQHMGTCDDTQRVGTCEMIPSTWGSVGPSDSFTLLLM